MLATGENSVARAPISASDQIYAHRSVLREPQVLISGKWMNLTVSSIHMIIYSPSTEAAIWLAIRIVVTQKVERRRRLTVSFYLALVTHLVQVSCFGSKIGRKECTPS